MKKTFILLTICVFALSVSSRGFTTLTVGDYPGYDSDIDNEDGHYFRTYMERNGFNSELFLEDADVNAEHFLPEKMTDYMYFSGHGNKGFVAITDGEKSQYVFQKDIGKVTHIRHLILASCLTVDTGERWSKSFGDSLVSLNGYIETSFDRTDNMVAKYFAWNVVEYDLNDSEGHVDAWMNANASASYKMKTRWSSMGYSNEDNSLCFWTLARDNRVLERSRISDAPSYTFASGRIRLFGEPTRNRAFNSSVKTRRENLLDIALFDRFPARGEIDRSTGGRHYQNGKRSLITFDSGAMIYQDLSSDSSDRAMLNMEQSMDVAYRFVLDNGGIPEGYKVTDMGRVIKQDMDHGSVSAHSYFITWESSFEDKDVRGNSGDAISVIVKDGKVVHYYRLCREKGSSSPVRADMLSPVEAIRKAGSDITAYVKTLDIIDVLEVSPVLHSPAYYNDSSELVPAYELVLTGGACIYVDAVKGVVLY